MSSTDNFQEFHNRRNSLRLYKNVDQDISDDKFYQNQLCNLHIVHNQDGSEFQDLTAKKLGQSISNQFKYHQQKQALIIFDSLPHYHSYAQTPPPNSKWEQTQQVWDPKIRSSEEYLKLKRNRNLSTSSVIWKDLNYNQQFMNNKNCALVEDVNLKKLNGIGQHLINNPGDLDHKSVTLAYHHVFNYLESNASKVSAKKLVCREPNVITKSTYNSIVDFHHLTREFGASKEYLKIIDEIQQQQPNMNQPPIETDKVFNCQTTLLSPGCVNNLTIAPLALGTLHIVRNGAVLIFVIQDLDDYDLGEFYAMFGHTVFCPRSSLQQANMFPDIGAIQKFAAKHELSIWCGLQVPGSMAIIRENSIWWSVPVTNNEIWMETFYFGRKCKFSLEYTTSFFKSEIDYLREDEKEIYKRCKYGCKSKKWRGDPIASPVIKANKFRKFEAVIRRLREAAQIKARKIRTQVRREKNERLAKLVTKSQVFTKVCIFHLFCLCFHCNLNYKYTYFFFVFGVFSANRVTNI